MKPSTPQSRALWWYSQQPGPTTYRPVTTQASTFRSLEERGWIERTTITEYDMTAPAWAITDLGRAALKESEAR